MEKLSERINLRKVLFDLEIDYINRSLYTTRGNITHAAEILGINRTTLTMRIMGLGDLITVPTKVYKFKVERKPKKISLPKERFPRKTKVEKNIIKYKTLPFNPTDTVMHEGWTNKDTFLCARAIDEMSEYNIKKIVSISCTGFTEKSKDRILKVLVKGGSDAKLKLSEVNFEEIVKEYRK